MTSNSTRPVIAIPQRRSRWRDWVKYRRDPQTRKAQTSRTISRNVARSLRDKRSQLLGRMACKPSNKYRIQTQQKKVGFGNPLEPCSKPSPVPSRRRPGCTDACIRVTRELVPVFVSQRHGAVVDGCKRPAHNAVSEYAFVRPGHVHIIALHPCKMQFAAADTCWNRDRRIDVPTPDCIPENELLTPRVDKGEENRGSDNGGQILSR